MPRRCARRVLLVSWRECREYCEGLRLVLESLREKHVCYSVLEEDGGGGVSWLLRAVASAAGYDTVHLCGYPSRLAAAVLLLLFVPGVKRVVVSIPPLPSAYPLGYYRYSSLFLGWLLFMHRVIGRAVRFVLPSPYEGYLVASTIHWAKRVYVPAFFVKERRERFNWKVDMEKITILAYLAGERDPGFLYELLENLYDVEIPARIVLLVDDEPCPDNPFITCIRGDAEALMEHVSLVYIPGAGRSSNRVLLQALMNGKPVVTGKRLGMALLHSEKGLVVTLDDPFNPEHVASAILDFVNSLDRYRRAIVDYKFAHPGPRELAPHLRYLAYD